MVRNDCLYCILVKEKGAAAALQQQNKNVNETNEPLDGAPDFNLVLRIMIMFECEVFTDSNITSTGYTSAPKIDQLFNAL